MPIAPDSGTPIFFRQLRSRVGNQMRQRDLFAWYEFLNNAFFIHD
ncbi:hypothetical protein [Klebsiella pneumoniae IS46]|uniref:Uncharacterized protein n=1 Tax=Klebsiella pneumoniae IS43 TaxID=1432552 RepID=W1DFV3_KLEPN|nr:hypothetical protein [Klebsiella pneumoniae IS43]CDL15979.1 hypothetical protein [Klebsiella pneumoniae IS46]CDL23886.1 hypothetical protein [Klebsiella pneumoniae IS53]CDL49983.1 hypothetical protein [Klebsiella pneumoniae ISC21]